MTDKKEKKITNEILKKEMEEVIIRIRLTKNN